MGNEFDTARYQELLENGRKALSAAIIDLEQAYRMKERSLGEITPDTDADELDELTHLEECLSALDTASSECP